MCDAGSFLIQGAKNVLSMLDAVLDVVATTGAVIVFVAGVVAIGTTIASTFPTLASAVILGHEIGAIGSAAGGFALFTGKIAIGASATQIISGASGYRLNGKRLSEGEAKSRMASGLTNLGITFTGLQSAMASQFINENISKGSTGRTEARDLYEQIAMERAKTNPFDPGDGNTVRLVVDELGDKRWAGWEKWEIVFRTNEGRKITIHFNYDPIYELFDDFKFK